MDFNFRQYDPQLGRFNSVDPLAASGGQDMISPYAAMGNAPESLTDPTGLKPGPSPKFSVAGVGGGLIDYSISSGYAAMLEAVANMALAGMEVPQQLLWAVGGGGSSGSWSRGSSGGQQYLSKAELTAIWNHILGLDNYVVGGFNIPLSTVAWYDGDFDGMPGIGSDPDGDGKYGIDDGGCKNCPVGPFEDSDNGGTISTSGYAIVANVENGAMGKGHNAILIGSDETGWVFFSKEGRAENPNGSTSGNNPSSGGPALAPIRETYVTFDDFLKNSDHINYNRFIEVNISNVNKVKDVMWREANSYYNILFNNCGTAVNRALEAGGVAPGWFITPNSQFSAIPYKNQIIWQYER